jgi:hypothetical protein
VPTPVQACIADLPARTLQQSVSVPTLTRATAKPARAARAARMAKPNAAIIHDNPF